MPTQQSGFPTLTRAGLIATAATGQQVVATLTGVPVAGPGLGGCLTQNGDFSNGSVGWALNAADAVDTTPADAPPGSSTCLKRAASGAVDGTTQTLPVLPNTTMAAGCYLKGDGTNGIQLAATYLNNAGVAFGTEQLSAAQTAASWAFQTVALATPGNCTSVRLSLKTTAASTTYAGRIGLVAGGTYADSQFSSNPLGNLSLVACEATTNLLADGDCEGVGGTATSVLFTDPFANAAAWTTVGGSAPTVASNVLTVAAGSTVVAGHPDWWDTQASGGGSSQVRFQPQASFTSVSFLVGYLDATHNVSAVLDGAHLSISQDDNGAVTTIGAAVACVLVAGTSYWLTWTRTGVTLTFAVKADGATPGATIATQSATITATTWNTWGKVGWQPAGAALLLGQMGGTAYAGVCQVSGPRPSAYSPFNSTGVGAYCWSKAQSFSGTSSLSIITPDTTATTNWIGPTVGAAGAATASCRYLTVGTISNNMRLSYGGAGTTVPAASAWSAYSCTNTLTGASQLLAQLNGQGLIYFDVFGIEQKPYNSLNLDPFPAFYVPTGARAAAKATVPLPGGLDNAHAWTVALTAALPGDLTNAAYLPDLLRTLDTNLRVAVTATGTLGAQLGAAGTAQTFRSGLVTKSPATAYRLVLAHDGAGTVRGYAGGVLQFTAAVTWATFLATLALGNGTSALVAGVVLANRAWSAAEVAADLANTNPPGLIANGGLFSQPGALYTQTPDASGNSLALPPPTGGRVVPDVIHTGVVRAGSLQPLTGQSTVGVQGAVFDAAGLLQAGGLKHISATVGTSQVAVAHGLGRVPSIILFFERSNATSWQSAVADGSNVYLTASVAGTSIDLYVS